MGDIVQKVTTDLTFGQNGVLLPPGSIINIDVTKGDFNDKNTPNLADVGDAVVNVPVAVAPIAPTGPNPTMPQQVPPGVFQTIGDVEEEGPVRRQPSEATGDATTGPAPVENGQNSGQTGGEGDVTFRPDDVIDGTVPEVAKRLEGLSREQLLAVKDAEQDREQPRVGVTSAIDALITKLDEDAAQA